MEEVLEHIAQEFEVPFNNPVLVFSLILLIILVSPILFKKLNIPGIIVLIISGVIIGPYGFNLVEKNSAVNLFSTIGLLYIMFIAGLELDMNQFKTYRNKSLMFGFFTFIVPLAIGFPVCYYLLNYDFNASFLTASMFSTHTLISYPIVSRLKLSKNEAIAITVGGTILTDTAVLILLAIIIGNHEGTLDAFFWQRLGFSLVIFCAIIFFVVPKVANWFFTKMESEKHSQYIFVLTVVFLAAFLAELAGVEPIIGAFLAGLALNRSIPHSSALMNRIEFIGNSLFIPFFLISVGMLVDVSVIFSGPMALLIAATLTIVALSGKWMAAFITQKVLGYSTAQRKIIFGLSSGHAAATLAVILVGFNAGIIDDNILNGTIILILITSIVATLATGNASKPLLLEQEASSEKSRKTILSKSRERILLPIANIVNFDKLLEFAILIKERSTSNPVSILSVVPNNEEAETNIAQAKAKLEDFVVQASASETKVEILATIDLDVASGIARISKEILADVIILGWPTGKSPDKQYNNLDERLEKIIKSNNKTTFVTHFQKPLATHKRIFVAVPPLAETEGGYKIWLEKISILSQELSVPVLIYCNQATEASIRMGMKKRKSILLFGFKNYENWDDLWIVSREIKEDDIFILVSAREGLKSYQETFTSIPAKLEKYFFDKSRIVVYP